MKRVLPTRNAYGVAPVQTIADVVVTLLVGFAIVCLAAWLAGAP